MVKDHLFIVFGAEHYNPLNVIRSIGKSGIAPIFIAVKNKGLIASKSKYIQKTHYVDSVEQGYEILLQEYGNLKKSLFCLPRTMMFKVILI